MPKHVIISKLGGPEVLKYQEYSLLNEIKGNEEIGNKLYSKLNNLSKTQKEKILQVLKNTRNLEKVG